MLFRSDVLDERVEHSVLDALVEDIEHAWKHGSDRVRVDILGTVVALRPEHREQPFKLLDLYVSSDAARNISCAPAIAHFLQLLFETRVLAFQSLTFEKGTEQRLHQDTAYVVVSEPLKLAASWVALEDISPGTGELEYFVGSHRLPDRPLSEVYKHFNPERDGNQSHEDFLDWLERESRARGLARTRFQPKKGDALIRAADLVHGGSKIEVPGRSRRSHVTHYCPVGVTPN